MHKSLAEIQAKVDAVLSQYGLDSLEYAKKIEQQDLSRLGQAILHDAWMWDCEFCGAENFCRAIVRDTEPDTEWEGDYDQVWIGHPVSVVCRSSGLCQVMARKNHDRKTA